MTNLLGKKKVYVYYINKLSQLRVYLDRTQVTPSSFFSTVDLILPALVISQSHSSINIGFLSIWCTQHLEHLQLLLTEQTDVEPGSQILLLNVTFHLETCVTPFHFPQCNFLTWTFLNVTFELNCKKHVSDLTTSQDTLLSKQVESNTPGTSFPETSDQYPVNTISSLTI